MQARTRPAPGDASTLAPTSAPPTTPTRRTGAARWLVATGAVSLAAAAGLALVAGAPAARAGDDTSGGSAGAGPAPAPAPAQRDRAPRDVAAAIDKALEAVWRQEKLTPNRRCSDEEFVRRVHLDLVGTIPTGAQVDDFLRDPSPAKREALVETLLASPGFARHMANQWGDVLVGTGTGDNRRDFVPTLFLQWLERQIAAERPYGDWVTELLTAEGTGYGNAPVNFTARKDMNPGDLAGAVSKSFLGVQIQCAQCHDHPYEEITQKDFESFSAFWGRVRIKPADIPYEMFGPQAVAREQARIERDTQEMVKQGIPDAEARLRAERRKLRTKEISDLPGLAKVPKQLAEGRMRGLGEAAKAEPRFLKGGTYRESKEETRRAGLARWITDPANPYTARALSNRMWGWFLGRGIVHPVDDFSSVNVPVAPEALTLLAADTAAHAFDLKRLARIITSTRAYQTSTASRERTAKAQEFFAAGPLKPLTSQQSFDSLNVALGVIDDGRALTMGTAGPTAIEMGDGRNGMARMAMDGQYERPERKALDMARAARSFFKNFEDDEGGSDESFEGTVPQGLFLLNSDAVNSALSRGPTVASKVVNGWKDDRDRVRQVFLRTLSREPTAAEAERFARFVREARADAPATKAGGRRGRFSEDGATAAYADALWVLISSSEFGSNH